MIKIGSEFLLRKHVGEGFLHDQVVVDGKTIDVYGPARWQRVSSTPLTEQSHRPTVRQRRQHNGRALKVATFMAVAGVLATFVSAFMGH